MTLANVAMSSPQHAEVMLAEGAMMVLLKLMTSGEAWAEKSAGHALGCLCNQIKHALTGQNKVSRQRLLAVCLGLVSCCCSNAQSDQWLKLMTATFASLSRQVC